MTEMLRELSVSYDGLIASWLGIINLDNLSDKAKLELLKSSMTEWLTNQTKKEQ